MSGDRSQTLRILVGAGCFADARDALYLLDRLDGHREGEIGGVLVEETVVTDIAGPRSQRVITAAGAMVVPSAQQLRRQLERDARAFRDMLSAVAGQRKWSFERRRGDLLSLLRDAAPGWDMLLVGHRKTQRLAGRVILIGAPAGAAPKAARFAGDLAQALGAPVLRLSLPGAENALGGGDPGAERFASDEALLARLGRIPAAAMVMDLSAETSVDDDRLQALIAAARCPTFVLGPSGVPDRDGAQTA